jgi:hypothetical protein
MAVPIRSQKYHDPVAAQRRHRVWFVRTFILVFVMGALGAAGYGLSRDSTPIPSGTPIALGTWCHDNTCRFFDRTGAQWGEALQSSGPLLLLIDDQRASSSMQARITQGIVAAADALPQMGLTVKSAELSDDQPGATITISRQYVLYLDPLGDIDDQMATLQIFLSDRAKDTAFAPAYIDLRTPGRVYYR